MITRTLILSAIMTIFLLALVGCQVNEQAATPQEVGASATAMMAAADGSPMGTVTLTQGQNGVLVSADLAGLSPGWHGFHIHGTGKLLAGLLRGRRPSYGRGTGTWLHAR